MTQYTIDIGAVPDDGQGDPLRTSFNFTNLNFDQIFAAGPVLSNVAIANNTIRTINNNGDLILAPNGIGRIQVKNTLLPSFDNVYDLGSPAFRFNTIYVGTGGINVPNISVTGNITGNNIFATGVMSAAGNVVSGGTLLGVSLAVSSATVYGAIAAIDINATGNIAGDYFIGNGSLLTGVQANSTNNISNGTSSITAAVANGNITVSIDGVSNTVVFTSEGLTAKSISALGNVTANNIVALTDVSATGNVTGNYLLGNGALITGIVAASSNAISSGNTDVSIPAPNANVSVTVNDTSNVAVFANTGAYIKGVVSATGDITAPNFIGNVIGNISGNITVPGANTQVIFNDNGQANAAPGFTFDKTSNLVTVGGNVSAVGFVGNGGGLGNVMADRGGDTNNWNALTQMGVYLVNRMSWSGTVGTPLDSQIFVGVLEVVNATNTALTQVFYPATVSEDIKIQWTRSYWSGSWTGWILMTNSGQVITGGDF